MNKMPVQYEAYSDFKGQYSDTDPLDCPTGTMYRQFNMMSVVKGELTTRGGLKEVTTDELE